MKSCQHCERQFKSPQGLSGHLRLSHGEESFAPSVRDSPREYPQPKPSGAVPMGPVPAKDPGSLVMNRPDLRCPNCGAEEAYLDYWKKYPGRLRCGKCCLLSLRFKWHKDRPPSGESQWDRLQRLYGGRNV